MHFINSPIYQSMSYRPTCGKGERDSHCNHLSILIYHGLRLYLLARIQSHIIGICCSIDKFRATALPKRESSV